MEGRKVESKELTRDQTEHLQTRLFEHETAVETRGTTYLAELSAVGAEMDR
jgi:hypothetical protein